MTKAKLSFQIENEQGLEAAISHIRLFMGNGPVFLEIKNFSSGGSSGSTKDLPEKLIGLLAQSKGGMTAPVLANRTRKKETDILSALEALCSDGKVSRKEGRVYRGQKTVSWHVN